MKNKSIEVMAQSSIDRRLATLFVIATGSILSQLVLGSQAHQQAIVGLALDGQANSSAPSVGVPYWRRPGCHQVGE